VTLARCVVQSRALVEIYNHNDAKPRIDSLAKRLCFSIGTKQLAPRSLSISYKPHRPKDYVRFFLGDYYYLKVFDR